MTNETPVTTAASGATQDERTWATITHLSAFTGYLVPIFTVLAPLFIWLLKKKEMPFVDDQGKEAVNFQITMLIGAIISIPLMIILIGYLTLFIIFVVNVVCIIIAAVHAYRGEYYRYPLSWRIIK